MRELYQEILEEVERLPVIDTHEHLPYCDEVRERNTDVLREYLGHYMSSDIISAGMKPADFEKVVDPSRPLLERWRIVEPYWEACRYTGYGRALDISVKAIYGINGVRGDTIEALNEVFTRSLAPGHFRRVLKDMCGIRISLLDGFSGRFESDRDLFRRVWRPDNYIIPMSHAGEVVYRLERQYGISIRTLDDWMEIFSRELEDALASGVVALKCGLAYLRPLRFEKIDFTVACEAFRKTMEGWEREGRKPDASFSFPVEVQDFMMHHILRVASDKHLTFQFHTGLQEGNGNTLTNSDPSLLTNLFLEYPDVDFDLFHISYPFQGIACALSKNFPNVFIDMCWAHIISPSAARGALDDFLDAVPYNKISAFGGDYLFVDGVYGHLAIARQNVSYVLAQKVEEGIFPLERAIDIASALFHDNPLRIFKLEGRL